ncbi:MAG: ferredoxin [Acidimicrobiia bacterium]
MEHAIRTACQIIGRPEVIVVGSQSILGTFREDELPAEATMSVEIDILPIADGNAEIKRLADLIEGAAGELSPFEELHGFSIDGVDLETSALPEGWRGRLVKVQNANTAAPAGRATVHRLVPRQGRSLRSEALRLSREGPELRRGPGPCRPRGRGRDREPVANRAGSLQHRACARLAGGPMKEVRRRMTVSVDADLCSGCGCCVALCGSVFTHVDPEGHDVGVSHVQQHGSVLPPGAAADVPPEYEAVAILAAEECPGEIIMIGYTDSSTDRRNRIGSPDA